MRTLIFTVLFVMSSPVWAQLSVFACEPEWASLTEELGGDDVSVFSATSGLQDPHYIQARPSLIAKARQTDLLICTGAELESGWLPLLQRKAGNPSIQTGAEGYFMASDYVRLLEKPVTVDRSQGHVHAAGNPHIQTSPANIIKVAEKLTQRLTQLDPENANNYENRWQDFQQRWQKAMTQWQEKAAPLRDVPIVVQHKNWIYLTNWLGLNEVAMLEAKPAVPPTVKQLQSVVEKLKQTPAKMVILAAYQSPRASDWLVDKTGITKVVLPYTVGGNEQSNNLFELYNNTIDLLLNGAE
jgi:zinc/manganese transport system substrate-binding protein